MSTPLIDVERFNVMAAIENDDRPSVFLTSFVGVNEHTGKKDAVHLKLDGNQLAKLMEQFCAAAISEVNYAVNGVRTHVTKNGVVFLPKQGDDDGNT